MLTHHTLKVNEIFYSLQGEGIRAGRPSIFIRLSDCNLRCDFCDTEFASGSEYSMGQLRDAIAKFPCREIIWTGGEPTEQLTEDILKNFQDYENCIETNGTNPVPRGIHFISLSPKVAEHIVKKNVPECNEIRYVRASGQAIPVPSSRAIYKYLSPMAKGDKLDKAAVDWCIQLCLQNPEWAMSVQQHKIWGVR